MMATSWKRYVSHEAYIQRKIMFRKIRRAINFDLSIKLLKEYYNAETPKNAYKELRSFFVENGFTHRQGSGYISVDPISDAAVANLCMTLKDEFPWLEQCAKSIDLTNVFGMHDILKFIKEINIDSNADQMTIDDFGIDMDKLNKAIDMALEASDILESDVGMEL